ncbi:hypothetical protein HU200_033875 [Digitaria exilis]|uniref:Uncharacterized protein n=1 Tax=Digitaria exilis TaxID=1010633 RepID=A0A835BUL4_9POAL|nr:hypothetical protein HU200_033875 [Digitaria exilis]
MHPTFDAASRSLSVTSAEGSSQLREQQQQPVHGAASPSPPGGDGVGIIICHDDCWLLAKADCAHRPCCCCCSRLRLPCPRLRLNRGRRRAHASLPRHVEVRWPTDDGGGEVRGEVSLEAVVFRRVRLGPHDAEVAYHATVTIGGHVFRGVLYDVGPARSRRRRSTVSTDTAGSSDESSRSTAGGGGLDLTLRL